MTAAVHAPAQTPRHWFGTAAEMQEVPHFSGHQLSSFERCVSRGIGEEFADLSPISDHTG